MFEVTVRCHNGETFSLSFPSVNSLCCCCSNMNEDVFIGDTVIFTRFKRSLDRPGGTYAGYTEEGVEALYKRMRA